MAAAGDGQSNTAPRVSVNIIVFDKNYNFLDAAFDQIDPAAEQVGVTPVVAHDLLSKEYTVNEEGYVFMYIANENATQVDAYFDDVAMTYTPTNIVQYNEYYPFGLQTSTSWTRENNSNNFLYNEGSELNSTTGWYETMFRGYDATIGRFMQVDPLAYMTHSMSSYQYANNSPALRNDPLGLKSPAPAGVSQMGWDRMQKIADWQSGNFSLDDWSESYGGGGTVTIDITRTWIPYTLDPNDGFWREEYDISVDLPDDQTPEDQLFHYFSNESKAIQFMIDKQSQYDVEITAMMVKNGKGSNMIIVQPWKGNSKHEGTSASQGVVYDEGFKRMVLKGIEYFILGSIHTHPNNGSGAYQGPSGPGNAYHGGEGDLGFYHSTNATNTFIIGVSEVSKLNPAYPFRNTVWADQTGGYHAGNRHAIGLTNSLINGDWSLFNFLRK